MSRPESRVNIGSIVDPFEGLQSALSNYSDRLHKERLAQQEQARWEAEMRQNAEKFADEQKRWLASHELDKKQLTQQIAAAKENERRWNITNTREEEKMRQWRDELVRQKAEREGLQELLNRSANLSAYALAANKNDRDAINKAVVDKWNDTIAVNPELKKQQEELQAKQKLGTATYDDVEAFRKKVMGIDVGNAGLGQVLNQAYQAYTPYKEEAGRALDLAARDLKLDPKEYQTLKKDITNDYSSQSEVRKALIDQQQKDFDNKIALAKLLKKEVKEGNSVLKSDNAAYNAVFGIDKPGDVAKAAENAKTYLNDYEGTVSGFNELKADGLPSLLNEKIKENGLNKSILEYAKEKGIKESAVWNMIPDVAQPLEKDGVLNYSLNPTEVKLALKDKIDEVLKNKDMLKYGDTKVTVNNVPLPSGVGSLTALRRNQILQQIKDIKPSSRFDDVAQPDMTGSKNQFSNTDNITTAQKANTNVNKSVKDMTPAERKALIDEYRKDFSDGSISVKRYDELMKLLKLESAEKYYNSGPGALRKWLSDLINQ